MNFREMTEADLPFFLTVRNESAEWLHDPRQFTMEECVEWFRDLPPYQEYIIIEDTYLHIPLQLGYFRLKRNQSQNGLTFYYEIGADIASTYRGKGIAYRAYYEFMHQLVKEAKAMNDADSCFSLEVLGHNIRALNLYLKLGFEITGAIELINRNGRMYPSISMEKWA